MVMNDKEFCNAVHLNIHAVRLIPNYNPTEFEKKISRLVLEKYKTSCNECKHIEEKIRLNPQKEKQSIFKKIGEVINNA